MCCFNGQPVTLRRQRAYRTFGLTLDHQLRASFRSYAYPTGVKSFVTDRPSADNEYGFHAYASPQLTAVHHDNALTDPVRAWVRLDGPAIGPRNRSEPKGWRAERLTLLELVVLSRNISGSPAAVARALRQNYPGVPVRVDYTPRR